MFFAFCTRCQQMAPTTFLWVLICSGKAVKFAFTLNLSCSICVRLWNSEKRLNQKRTEAVPDQQNSEVKWTRNSIARTTYFIIIMNLLSSAPSTTAFGRHRLRSTAHSFVHSSSADAIFFLLPHAFASIIIKIYGSAMWSVPKLYRKKMNELWEEKLCRGEKKSFAALFIWKETERTREKKK